MWLRPDGATPWEYDVLLMTHRADTWVFKRDPDLTAPLEQILWQRDGVSYLRPEVQLLHKARARRPQDQLDFAATWPLLDGPSRTWLISALERVHPGHAWLAAAGTHDVSTPS